LPAPSRGGGRMPSTMRISSAFLAVALLVPLLALQGLVLVGCGSSPLSQTLSFAQAQSLNPGVSAEWILSEYPYALVSRRKDGSIARMEYRVTDPNGKARKLFLEFDGRGVMVRKRYLGPIVRPPKSL
ncbi:MAG: hypothetical protein ACC662_11630, partial [Planctomycetota bacterium]